MRLCDDVGAARVMRAYGLKEDALLGSGGEAWVFALDTDRVLRLAKEHTRPRQFELRRALLEELACSAERVPFALPRVLEQKTVAERLVAIEVRLPGRALSDVLAAADLPERSDLVRAYLDAANRIGDLELERSFFGEVCRVDAIEAQSHRGYLEAAAARSLAVAGSDFSHLDASALAAALPECATRSPVHLDTFPGNMLVHEGRISAVIDFGPLSIAGDRRLDPLTAAAYLAPEITPGATREDWRVAQAWLTEQGLSEYFEPAHRWLAAFWSGAVEDRRLQQWSRRVLGIPSSA